MKTLNNYINEQLEKHINIDYAIFEHAGLYDGIEDLARFLTNKIKNYTVEKIKKDLKNRYTYVMNHINSNIGKICARYVKTLAIKDKNPNTIKFKLQ